MQMRNDSDFNYTVPQSYIFLDALESDALFYFWNALTNGVLYVLRSIAGNPINLLVGSHLTYPVGFILHQLFGFSEDLL